ncbi:MAG: alpha/beta fold hydrolase [Anaeromyxobacteraceae bacterium]
MLELIKVIGPLTDPTAHGGPRRGCLRRAITVFPEEVYRPPESWARRAYRNLIYFHEVDRGGHFAAWEHPELFAAELRAAFRPLRSTLEEGSNVR